jgi:hypothetical protein
MNAWKQLPSPSLAPLSAWKKCCAGGWRSSIGCAPCINNCQRTPVLGSSCRSVSDWEIVPFDERAADQVAGLRRQRIRIGTMDLKIASIALVNDALLVTANLRDFSKVPALRCEDWLKR